MIELEEKGYDKVLKLLVGMKDEQRDEAERNALKEAGEVLVKAVKALPSPRSTIRRKGHAFHLLDTVEAKYPSVMGSALGIETGFFRKKSYYAYYVEGGTPMMGAQPFFLPTFEKTQNEQLDAMQTAIRKGLGL